MIDVSEVMQLADDLRDAGKNIAPKVRSATTKTRNELAVVAEQGAPVGETGDLKAGFETSGTGLTQYVTNRTRQAFFQQFGTSRHPPQAVLFDYTDRFEPIYEERVVDALRGML